MNGSRQSPAKENNTTSTKPDLIHSEKKVIDLMTYTIDQITNMQQEQLQQYKPSVILIHCGTNDLEKETRCSFQSNNKYVESNEKYFPSKIIYSSLLICHDFINTKVSQLNSEVEQVCNQFSTTFLNQHIEHEQLFFDRKHLNHLGFFVKNLKSGIYGTHKQPTRTNNWSTTRQAVLLRDNSTPYQEARQYQRANTLSHEPVNHSPGLPFHLKHL